MSDHDNDQKTEQPTDKHVHEAHEQGQFARSQELGVVLMLAAGFGVFSMAAEDMARGVAEFATRTFAQLHAVRLDSDTATEPLLSAGLVYVGAFAPVLAATVVAALLAGGLQSGFQLTPKVLGFKPERLDPIAGFGRVFSKAAVVHGGVDLLKLAAIGGSLWLAARTLFHDPLFQAPVETAYLGQFLHQSALSLLARLLLALGVVAAISYAYERVKTTRDLMMTREQVKEEHKQAEGDAFVKSAMRRMARRFMQKQMLAAVPTADVVVTNPTHYAVALKYERGVDKAPIVLAKGDNRLAQRIKAIAAENGVPMVENRPVARFLFAAGKVGEPIPAELFQAVAEILAFVYRTHRYYFFRLRSRRAAGEGRV